MRVACIGEAMIEMSLDGDAASIAVAGDTLNTAVYLKRSAPEIEVDYITRLGVDPMSDRIRGFIASEEIGTERIGTDPVGVPGLYAITLNGAGERSFTYWRSASAARGMFADRDFSTLEGYDLIYLSGISMAILPHRVRLALVEYLRNCPAKIAFDSNHRQRLWNESDARQITSEFWSFCDIPLPSIDDEMALFEETSAAVETRCRGMRGLGALKRGASGPLSIGEPIQQNYSAAASVVDTTAAGDSFNGGYLAARLRQSQQADALRAGHELAARVVGYRGAIIPKNAM